MHRFAGDAVNSPSQFMRQLRPELYSDSSDQFEHGLRAEILSHHLETITDRNETHDFELFCRKLCERTICPNLRPATGPEGGGDSKADTETTPVSSEIQTLTYIGEANSGCERWAFAFSAKKAWADKVRADVAGIMDTERGYQKVFFVTSRPARAKDRARLEDELSDKYGVQVVIHDRSWIIKEVIENGRQDLAYNYLGIGEQISTRALGPTDYSRQQQLDDIERALSEPAGFVGREMERATEALVAAKLARGLELPRFEVDGRFQRAVRLADDGGALRQQYAARYEALWTAFWWYDDICTLLDGYDSFEARVIDSDHAVNLELLCNLAQLLYSLVIHGVRTAEQVKLEARVGRLVDKLEALANDTSRPNNALEAATSALVFQVNAAVLAKAPERLVAIWPRFGDILGKAECLGEYDAERLSRMIEVFGHVAGTDRGYRRLVDQLSDFVVKRTGEIQAARILLNRSRQLELDQNMELIRLLGKAVLLLSKKEEVDRLVDAQLQLGLAYQSAGLHWAARASCTGAATALFIEAETTGALSSQLFPALMNTAWQALQLKHLPEMLKALQLAKGCLKAVSCDDTTRQRADTQLADFDRLFACQLLNFAADEAPRLAILPDVLLALDLPISRFTLLYLLGYEHLLREEGWVPQDESTENIEKFFSFLASQPCVKEAWRPVILNDGHHQVLATKVLGMQVNVIHQPSDTAITVSEAIAGTLEAFFATAFEVEAYAHAELFEIEVVETDGPQVDVHIDLERMRATVVWPAGVFPGAPPMHAQFLDLLLRVATNVFTATCHIKEFEVAIEQLFKSDAAMGRLAMIGSVCNSRERMFNGVARLDMWNERNPHCYAAKPHRPQVKRETVAEARLAQSEEQSGNTDFPATLKDHRQLTVRSVIDVHLWDRAGWLGTAYGTFSHNAPPFMALLFKDRSSAIKIFERWRDRFGAVDKNEALHISIIRQLYNQPATHYGLVITSRPSESVTDSQYESLASRSMTMTPETDINLCRFLDDHQRAGCYLLVPAVMEPERPPEIIKDVYLLKRNLHVKTAAEVGPHDMEHLFLVSRGYATT
ncbi:hypothetical protein SAMN05216185_101229 [Pseudomonas guariconensis]|uniref:tetratricopeptide repeat protein n=1 Tax=Pseudomonas guariconensis TaxID=1288410 RepID=UPI00088C326D|nr:tetratricopeptide repeat protein [Pseudomonas guariconensis]SDC02969.1 hypothetical protein SAMN05216185_101229 [Pseudomonas guariconensis]